MSSSTNAAAMQHQQAQQQGPSGGSVGGTVVATTTSSSGAMTTTSTSAAADKIAREYTLLTSRFERLAEDTHLPFLEVSFYTTNFVEPRLPERLQQFRTIVEALEEHRTRTVKLLALCCEREIIMAKIFEVIHTYKTNRKQMTTLQLQTSLLRCLYQHQQLALAVVEGVFRWREGLSRPYPFIYKGRNCLLGILADCERIEAEDLSSALPLQLRQYPLSSNVDALKLFSEEQHLAKGGVGGGQQRGTSPPNSRASTPRRGGGGGDGRIGGGMSTPRKGGAASSSSSTNTTVFSADSIKQQLTAKKGKSKAGNGNSAPTMAARLQAAEEVLLTEPHLQQDVADDLQGLADKGLFVFIVDVPEVIPTGSCGIPVNNRAWEQQLASAVAEMREAADKVINGMSDGTA